MLVYGTDTQKKMLYIHSTLVSTFSCDKRKDPHCEAETIFPYVGLYIANPCNPAFMIRQRVESGIKLSSVFCVKGKDDD